jgi:hypothetical protein
MICFDCFSYRLHQHSSLQTEVMLADGASPDFLSSLLAPTPASSTGNPEYAGANVGHPSSLDTGSDTGFESEFDMGGRLNAS